MGKRSIIMLAASLVLLSAPVTAQDARSSKLGFGVITGGGYATFDVGGPHADNLYWVSAVGGPGNFDRGLWYADVFIEGIFDFEALYEVDCVNVNRRTREAWIDGTIIESNDPANLGIRATLYIKDGADGVDQHGITPLAADAPRNNCNRRPEPDFRETAQSGSYIIQ